MYIVKKTIEIAGCHRLELPYESKCAGLHGHNWIITVHCKSQHLNEAGMVVDFHDIKELVNKPLDHTYLNDILPFNPTAENIAKWICERVPGCFRVDVEESHNNTATYILDEDLNLL